jgi:hypothetical protein
MTPLQVSVLWNCTQRGLNGPGIDALWIDNPDSNRQINWLRARRLIRKLHGRWVATRAGIKLVLYQVEDWNTIPADAKEKLAARLKRSNRH